MEENVTPELVRKFIREFDDVKNDKYHSADLAIIELMKTFPKNKKLEQVLLKVCVINKLYNAGVIDVIKVARHIAVKKLNIDRLLLKDDISAVEKIRFGHKIKTKLDKERDFYSFATKYCNWHRLQGYPIYDKFVVIALKFYKKYGFSDFNISDLRNYKEFKRVICDFKNYYKLQGFSFKEIDKFLFLRGRELTKL